ncbi:hypothetical protein CEXT_435111 [Caerostris extrusa]|uniref:Uncharacterized protein n=1 Tax=Caerostris extrusa TaxID=172846 RepID=A0AAV4RQK0_CAEEX|nr:hypothetical protein CEXT_435111 [Caerostris extrusa]
MGLHNLRVKQARSFAGGGDFAASFSGRHLKRKAIRGSLGQPQNWSIGSRKHHGHCLLFLDKKFFPYYGGEPNPQ